MKTSENGIEKEKDKEKKRKSRLHSPSFRKGLITEISESQNKGKEQDELKIINLVSLDEIDQNPQELSNKKSNKIENDNLPKRISNDIINVYQDGHLKKVGSYTQAGKGEDGFTKINQDSFLVIQNEYKMADFNIFSVLDGHGENGHSISRFITKYIATFFKKNKKMQALKTEEEVYNRLKKNEYDIIKRIFKHAEKDIEKAGIDANFSGTTCILVFQIGDKIITANVGDSRAIMVKGEKFNTIIPLSTDQKPNDPEEKERIELAGGEVSQYEDEGEKTGPFRVWAKGKAYPGIAMSRSIGDYIATSLGVIPDPICTEETIDNDTKFLIIATDGIWEFIDNKKSVDIVLPFYEKNDPDGACKALVKEAVELWNKEDIVVDDISVIVAFF